MLRVECRHRSAPSFADVDSLEITFGRFQIKVPSRVVSFCTDGTIKTLPNQMADSSDGARLELYWNRNG